MILKMTKIQLNTEKSSPESSWKRKRQAQAKSIVSARKKNEGNANRHIGLFR